MPVSYTIDPAEGLIRTQCSGNVSLPEVIEHFQSLERDPYCPARLDVLLDLSTLTSLPDTGQLDRVAYEIGRIRQKVKFGLCAAIAPTDAMYGTLRMFEVIAHDHFTAICIFRTSKEAEFWLRPQMKTGS